MLQVQSLPTSTVLLIEADPSLRRLIMLGLLHSGIRVVEASSVQRLSALDTQTLDLLIVDVDQGVKSDWSLLSALREQAHLATLPMVALSWEKPAEDNVSVLELPGSAQGPYHPSPPPRPLRGPAIVRGGANPSVGVGGGAVEGWGPCADPGYSGLFSHRGNTSHLSVGNLTCLSKPFDARALHSTIAKLLAERDAQKAAQVAMMEAQVLASYERHAAPSIWPVVTAAGLLLVVTGLLLHFLVALVGVVLMLTSLLLWTLGTKPASPVLPPAVSGVSGSA